MEEYIPVILAAIVLCIAVVSCFKPNCYSEADIYEFLADIKLATLTEVNVTRVYYFPFKVTLINGSIVLEKPVAQVLFPFKDNTVYAPIIVQNTTVVGLVELQIVSKGSKVEVSIRG